MKNKYQAFTLIEILIVVSIIAILASFVILVVDPAGQLANARNAQRKTNALTILQAVYQYGADNKGTYPANIQTSSNCPGATNEICKTGGACAGLVDLSVLTNNELYLTVMPEDPDNSSLNGTGYNVSKSVNGRITVCAPLAEASESINITK